MGQAVRKILFGSHDPYADIATLMTYNSFGWNSNAPEFQKYIGLVQPKLIVEVGTWFGGSAINMSRLAQYYQPAVEVVCIDTFLGSVEHWHEHQYLPPESAYLHGRPVVYEQFISNVLHTKQQTYVTPFPIDSINGALTLMRYGIKADLVYIDAGHEYENVSQDLKLFKNIVRPGGVMLIDDSHYEPIQRAAREQLTGNIKTEGTKIIWTN